MWPSVGVGLLLLFGYFFIKPKHKSVLVVVLGDIGRSPRMQYHGLSFQKRGYRVDFLGYQGSPPLPHLKAHFHYLDSPKKLEKKSLLLYLIQGIHRVIKQMIHLIYLVLFVIPKPQCIIIQVRLLM